MEDNPLLKSLLERRLGKRGFILSFAEDGRSGLERAAEDKPDVILMDMNLPVLDGWNATRKLKADSATHLIPIIALTAHAMAGDRERALEAGCDDYITKPIQMNSLLSKIRELTGRDLPPAAETEPP
ncbi:MAG: response regulator [Opitutales bacterium]